MRKQIGVREGVINVNPFSGSQALCDQLPRFKALSAGALILGGLFDHRHPPFHLTPTDEFRSRAAQVQHLLTESNRMGESGMWGGRTFPAGMEWIDFVPAGLKVVLDICDVNATRSTDHSSNRSTSVHLKRISLVFVV